MMVIRCFFAIQAPQFNQQASNFGIGDVGRGAEPTFVDIDGDGDFDVFLGNEVGNTVFFLNSGTIQDPQFKRQPTNFGITDDVVLAGSSHVFADIDGDGDLDAFVSGYFGDSVFFRNIGTAQAPRFIQEMSNFGLTNYYLYVSSPIFTDIDGDGDLDAFLGGAYGETKFILNTGTSQAPQFSQQINNFGIGDVGSHSSPALADVDGDGDLDAFVGNGLGDIIYFRNNNVPTFSSFANVVNSGLANTTVSISFEQLAAQGNVKDSDGTVTSFLVQAVTSGSL